MLVGAGCLVESQSKVGRKHDIKKKQRGFFSSKSCNVGNPTMKYHLKIWAWFRPPIKMVTTRGWFMALVLPHLDDLNFKNGVNAQGHPHHRQQVTIGSHRPPTSPRVAPDTSQRGRRARCHIDWARLLKTPGMAAQRKPAPRNRGKHVFLLVIWCRAMENGGNRLIFHRSLNNYGRV